STRNHAGLEGGSTSDPRGRGEPPADRVPTQDQVGETSSQMLYPTSKQGASFPSPMAQNIRTYEDALRLSERGRVEVIQPWTAAPYSQRLGQWVKIESSKKRARQLALDLLWKDTLYPDGSYRNNRRGAAVVRIKGDRVPVTTRSETIGNANSTSIQTTDLHAIVLALEHIQAMP
ncbi:hypothetical protein LTR66_012283, partial [Elasticomyces elasticus]